MTDTITVSSSGSAATQIVAAGDPASLVSNPGPNTVYLGDTDAIRVTDASGIVPLAPNGFINTDGSSDLYATIAQGQTQVLNLLTGASNFFSPPSLAGLGGAKVFIQATAPTQPPTIPLNSIWLNTTLNALETWNGSLWVVQAFAGNELIVANTIGTNQLIANLIYAGIVNGTEIDGSIFRAKNASGATILTINKTSGTWILYSDTGSATQGAMSASAVAATANVTDEFGNVALPGLTAYGLAISGTWVASNFGVTNSAFGVVYYTATSQAGPWSIDSWLRRSGSNAGQIEAGPIIELLATTLLPATPAAGAKLWVPNSSNTPRVMKPDGNSGYGYGVDIAMTVASQTISAGWEVTIAGGGISLVAAIISGQQYYFEAMIRFTTSAVGSATVGFAVPTASQIDWLWQGDWSLTISGSGNNPGQITIGTSAAAGTYTAKIWGTFTCSASGNFSCGAGTGTAGNFVVNAGTFMKIRTVG